MKYSKTEKLKIGQQIYTNEMTRFQAAEVYGISSSTAREFMRMYRDANSLPPKSPCGKNTGENLTCKEIVIPSSTMSFSLESLQSLSKEELINELIRSKINEARLKKGYEVKGDGLEKVFHPLGKVNMK